MKTGIELIEQERIRQKSVEGFTDDSEKYRGKHDLERAALAYEQNDKSLWPWSDEWWKPTPNDEVRQLVKSGALFTAEADRLNKILSEPYTARLPIYTEYDRIVNSINRVSMRIDRLLLIPQQHEVKLKSE